MRPFPATSTGQIRGTRNSAADVPLATVALVSSASALLPTNRTTKSR